MRLFLILMLFYLAIPLSSANAMSFMTKEQGKRMAKEAKHVAMCQAQDTHGVIAGLTPLQLFQSPIQPGGRYLLGVNWMNVLQLVSPTLAAKLNKGFSAVDRYTANLVETDQDIRDLNADPTPDRNYKAKLMALKDSKCAEYRLYVLGMVQ